MNTMRRTPSIGHVSVSPYSGSRQQVILGRRHAGVHKKNIVVNSCISPTPLSAADAGVGRKRRRTVHSVRITKRPAQQRPLCCCGGHIPQRRFQIQYTRGSLALAVKGKHYHNKERHHAATAELVALSRLRAGCSEVVTRRDGWNMYAKMSPTNPTPKSQNQIPNNTNVLNPMFEDEIK